MALPAATNRVRQENKPPVRSRVLILFAVAIFPAQRHPYTAVTLANLIYMITDWGFGELQ
jgi:hypothetical protein